MQTCAAGLAQLSEYSKSVSALTGFWSDPWIAWTVPKAGARCDQATDDGGYDEVHAGVPSQRPTAGGRSLDAVPLRAET